MSLTNKNQGVPGQSVQTNTRGLLDVINTPTAASFSLRQLTSKYTGPVVLVRRQSDLISNNFVADFSGNLSNVQNGTTLQTFLTSTYGNVTTWYDQSGNGRNASQASATAAPVIIQTSNLNMKWALTTTYANPAGSTFLNVSGGTFLNATDFTIMSTSRRTITSNNKTNNALYAYGANSSWQSFTSNVTYPDNSRFACEFTYQGNRASWNQRANPQNAEAFATIPYYSAASEPVTYLSLVSKGSANQTTLYCNNAVVSTTAAYAQCTANASAGFTIGGASAYGYFGGEIGELIIFPSAMTAAQVSQNYNSEVKNSSGGVVSLTGTPLFTQLSQAATSSAVGAFSLRAVNGTTAKAIRVKRASDNAQQDFYADRLGNLLTAPVTGQSLANWLGGATGYVTTWYDQSGRGNHATQGTAANQPIIQRATKGSGYSCLYTGTQNLALGSNAFIKNTPYTIQIVERRTVDSNIAGAYYLTWGGSEPQPTSNIAHIGYRAYSLSYPSAQTTIYTNQYNDDLDYRNIAIKFSTAATENVAYTWHTHDLSHIGRTYTWRGGTMYPSTFSTNIGTFQNYLNPVANNSYFIGGASGFTRYQGEIYELLIFTQSLYDLDNTGGLITKIYQNQLGAYGT